MMIQRPNILPTMHDRQDVLIEGPLTTTSTTFVDIPGASLITKDLGSAGNYMGWISLSLQQTTNNSAIIVRAVLDGEVGGEREVPFGPGSANDPKLATLIAKRESINSGAIIKFQWRVDTGQGQMNNARLMIDGIRTDRAIP